MSDERTTEDLMLTLDDDVRRCHDELKSCLDAGTWHPDGSVEADYEYHARQLIRAIFALIEGITFSVKASAAWRCICEGIELSPQEGFLATDVEHEINDKGEVVERPARVSLSRNVRFAFALLERSERLQTAFDPSVEWWACLKKAIRVRDRLMHPKMPGDLDVTGEEIVWALKAKDGFIKQLESYGESAGRSSESPDS